MKNILNNAAIVILSSLMSVQAFAQEKKLDVDIDVNKGDANWYMQPWVWVVAGAVFLLLLVAMLRGGGNK